MWTANLRAACTDYIVQLNSSKADLQSSAPLRQLAPQTNLRPLGPQLRRWRFCGADPAAARAQMAADPRVRRVEPDLQAQVLGAPAWAQRDLRGAQGPAPRWPRALGAAKPGPSRRIGLLDTGVDLHHPDLQAALRPGINLLSPEHASPQEAADSSIMDYHGHGTALAGILGATHNAIGIDGIDPRAQIVGIKVLNAAGQGHLSDILAGIAWARRQSIGILCMAWELPAESALLDEALLDAAAAGIELVAAAGNDGAPELAYPARHPAVLSVGSTDPSGRRLSRTSNFGPEPGWAFLGEGLLSTTTQRLGPNPYAPVWGTSGAAASFCGYLSRAGSLARLLQHSRLQVPTDDPCSQGFRTLGALLPPDLPPADRGSGPDKAAAHRELAPGQLIVRHLHAPGGSSSGQVLVRLHNPSAHPSPQQTLQIGLVATAHEGLGQLPTQPLGRIDLPPVAPGTCLERRLPLEGTNPLPERYSLTAELHPAGAPPGLVWVSSAQRSPTGQARALYSEATHVHSVASAVRLLANSNQPIPDLHAPGSPYLGNPQALQAFGGPIPMALGRRGWSWDTDWPTYPAAFRTLLDGASAADAVDVAYGQSGYHLWDTHFWIVDAHDDAGLNRSHSAYTKLGALVLGDPTSSLPQGAVAAYQAGDKARAWWLLGHAAHLLGDLSTSAHTLNENWHGVVGDAYHDWIGEAGHFRLWPAEVVQQFGGPIEVDRERYRTPGEQLRFLAYTTAQVGQVYPWHRLRQWLPVWGEPHAAGNRRLGGDWPHYDAELGALFATLPQRPQSLADLDSYEVRRRNGRCARVVQLAPFDVPTDCDLDGHIDQSNTADGDIDGDLSRIGDAAYTYAVRSIAGLLYWFAQQTGQVPGPG
jgi:hypothetical protein